MQKFDCAVIGNWHLAFVTAASLSALGHKVVLVNPRGIKGLPEAKEWTELPQIPVHEPGLNELLQQRSQLGFFSYANDLGQTWTAPKVWLAVDTPITERDEPILQPLEDIATEIAKLNIQTFVLTSQVPVGFCKKFQQRFDFQVAYVPENLRLGKGLDTFLRAERMVIGAESVETRENIRADLRNIPAEFVLCSLETAEMVKHATNIFLATSISFANELARVGETAGVDSEVVAQALKLDKRIGPMAYVRPGLGFAGGTLPRDLRVIKKIGEERGVPTPLVNAVLQVNEDVYHAVGEAAMQHLGPNKRVLLLGYTYKADTDTLRRSPALQLAEYLKRADVKVDGYDPVVKKENLAELNGLIEHHAELNASTPRPDVIIVMTARLEFKTLPWKQLAEWWKQAESSPLVFDTQSLLTAEMVPQFRFKPIWRPIEKGLA